MNLNDTLAVIAERFGLDAQQLIAFAAEDDAIGGYNSDPVNSKWEIGSIWDVEGRTLYALVRATQPRLVVQLGGWRGCSANHLSAAIKANDNGGKLISVDRYGQDSNPTIDGVPLELVVGDGVEYVEKMPKGKVDFLFEDMEHGTEEVRQVWTAALARLKKGAFIVSHDAAHFTVGAAVTAGIRAAGVEDALVVLSEPSDCGLAIARKE